MQVQLPVKPLLCLFANSREILMEPQNVLLPLKVIYTYRKNTCSGGLQGGGRGSL